MTLQLAHRFDASNEIDSTAIIGPNVTLGRYNTIGAGAIVGGFKGEDGPIVIGDCNRIGERVKLLAGAGGLAMGDWCTLHEDVLVLGAKRKVIGHNCWVGRGAILDSTGGLTIGNGVSIGCYTEVWTHVARAELIEGCVLFGDKPVVLEDDAWLVGSCFVSPGVHVGKRGIVLARSLVTSDVGAGEVWSGAPAGPMMRNVASSGSPPDHRMRTFYRDVPTTEKFVMMRGWLEEFTKGSDFDRVFDGLWYGSQALVLERATSRSDVLDTLKFAPDVPVWAGDNFGSLFCFTTKRYTKRLTPLERDVLRFLGDHKARFVPVGQERIV